MKFKVIRGALAVTELKEWAAVLKRLSSTVPMWPLIKFNYYKGQSLQYFVTYASGINALVIYFFLLEISINFLLTTNVVSLKNVSKQKQVIHFRRGYIVRKVPIKVRRTSKIECLATLKCKFLFGVSFVITILPLLLISDLDIFPYYLTIKQLIV